MKRNGHNGSITALIKRVSKGDRSAVGSLLGRFWRRLTVRGKHLVDRNELQDVDEEDIAQVVFHDVIQRISEHKIEEVESRKHLWRLMELAAYHRAVDLFRQESAGKRSSETEVPEPGEFQSKDPPPGFFVSLEDDLEKLSSSVDASSKTIVMMIYQGHTLNDIAEQLNLSQRTVQRKLALIRDAWMQMDETEQVDVS